MRYKAQLGIRVFNNFNYRNPLDPQENIANYGYGTFLNSVDGNLRGEFVLEF